LFNHPLHPDASPADFYFTAPENYTRQLLKELALARGFPKDNAGKRWKHFQIASAGTRYRLTQHEAALAQAIPGTSVCADYYFDVNQTPQFMPASSLLGTLLRRSRPWSHRLRRMLGPLEAIETMGIGPLFPGAPEPDLSPESAPPLFSSLLEGEFTSPQVRSLAENGICTESFGAAFMFLLGGVYVERPPQLDLQVAREGGHIGGHKGDIAEAEDAAAVEAAEQDRCIVQWNCSSHDMLQLVILRM